MRKVMKAVPLVVLCAFIIAVPSAWANWVKDGAALCTAPGFQQYPEITSDGAGGAIVTWQDSRGRNSDIYAQRVNASGAGQWTANGVALCTAPGYQQHPEITSDGVGGAIVTWENDRSGNYDIYAQRVNASGDVQWTTNGVPLCTATGDKGEPQIISDGAGGAIVTWHCQRAGSNYEICAQRVNASGTVLWTANGIVICTATEKQSNHMITSDGASGAIVTWHDQRAGSNYEIYAQRVNASGVVLWTPNGIILCTAAGDKRNPIIVSDGVGGAIVTWLDKRSGNDDIYAQRVNASGAAQWTASGVALCKAAGHQMNPEIAPDGVGGAIVAWWDNRSGNGDIYAQRVNASGAAQWTTDGVTLCTAKWNQWLFRMISDGAGGAIVTWQDHRDANADIYAQRVNASGAFQWAADGVALCTATEDQWAPKITSDGAGGAIVTWYDYRRGADSQHIYGLRVDANGCYATNIGDSPGDLRIRHGGDFVSASGDKIVLRLPDGEHTFVITATTELLVPIVELKPGDPVTVLTTVEDQEHALEVRRGFIEIPIR